MYSSIFAIMYRQICIHVCVCTCVHCTLSLICVQNEYVCMCMNMCCIIMRMYISMYVYKTRLGEVSIR